MIFPIRVAAIMDDAPGEVVDESGVSAEIVPEFGVPVEAVPEPVVPVEFVPEPVVLMEIVPESVVSEEIVMEEIVMGEIVMGEIVMGERPSGIFNDGEAPFPVQPVIPPNPVIRIQKRRMNRGKRDKCGVVPECAKGRPEGPPAYGDGENWGRFQWVSTVRQGRL